MGKILRYVIVMLLADITMINFRVLAEERVTESFVKLEVVPDVIPVAPTDLLEVYFPSGVEADLGNELTPTQVKDEPILKWDCEPDALYTVTMTDPDAPSRKEPTFREWHHWLVGNVPACNVGEGEVLTEYVGSAAPLDTGLHRYVFLVYKQPGKLTFDEPRIPNNRSDGRPNFSIAKFAIKYNLDNPIAGNMFQAEYDDYVPILNAQLGL